MNKNKEKIFASWYNHKGKVFTNYTFQQAWNEAELVANHLCDEEKISRGDRVVICYTPGLQFFIAFLGCLRAGVVAVLVYPPAGRHDLGKALSKITTIIRDCDAKLVLIDSPVQLLKKFVSPTASYGQKVLNFWSTPNFLQINKVIKV